MSDPSDVIHRYEKPEPTILYVRDDRDSAHPPMTIKTYRPASRSEVIEALGIDYEAASHAIDAEVKRWPSPSPSGLVKPGWWGATTLELAKAAVDSALGMEDDE